MNYPRQDQESGPLPPRMYLMPADSLIQCEAKVLGGRAFYAEDGRIVVTFTFGGREVPVVYENEAAADAGLREIARQQMERERLAEIAERAARQRMPSVPEQVVAQEQPTEIPHSKFRLLSATVFVVGVGMFVYGWSSYDDGWSSGDQFVMILGALCIATGLLFFLKGGDLLKDIAALSRRR